MKHLADKSRRQFLRYLAWSPLVLSPAALAEGGLGDRGNRPRPTALAVESARLCSIIR